MSENKDIKTALPKLRFPEFIVSDEWINNSIGRLSRSFSGGTPSTTKPEYYGGTIPFIRSAEIDKASTELFITDEGLANSSARVVAIGDLLIALYGANSGDVAISKINGAINQAVLCVKSDNNVFLRHYLAYSKDNIVNTYIQGGQGNLSGEIIKSINFYFPTAKEQTKIADCLSSLDDAISGVSDKVETLKEYKKGLMQQLFPTEGKTTPAFRFPEFQNSGEWVETTLGAELNYENGKAHENGIVIDGHYVVVNSKFISTDGAVRKYTDEPYCIAEEGDILMVLSDVPNGRAIAKCFLVDKQDYYTVNQRVCRLSTKGINSNLLYYVINRNKYLLSFDDGVKQTNLKKENVLKCPLVIPRNPNEQKMIANCLSSIDNLIIAVVSSLTQLKEHKKGLMQQLFPNINE